MKKLLIASTLSLASIGLPAGVALAASITNTGPGSYNVITNEINNNLTITCNNHTDVVYVNNQSANSGQVTLDHNTSGGYAFSGNAVNTSNNKLGLDVSCAPAKQVSQTTPTTPPPAGGQGGGQVLGTTTQKAPVAAQLPSTGPSPLSKAVIASLALVGSGLVVISGVVPAAVRKLF